jgi:hypothetical protein
MTVLFCSLNALRGINDQKPPLFLYVMSIPHVLHCMYSSFDVSFESNAELVNAARFLGFVASHKKDALCEASSPSFTNSNWSHSWTLMESKKSTHRPWWRLVAQPLRKFREGETKTPARISKLQEPMRNCA